VTTIPATASAAYPANSTASLAVTSNTTWSASSNQTWAVVSLASGSGSATVTVTCAANPNAATRSATITVGTQTCILTQAAAPAVTSIPATASAAYPANSTASLAVTSNTTWSASSNQTWAVVSPASGSGSATVTVTCAANPNTATRSATITVGTQTCILTQAAAPSAIATLSGLSLSSGTLSPTFALGTLSYTASVPNATTSITLTATLTDIAATIKVNGATLASGSASGSIALAVGINTIATVVSAQDGTTAKTYTVTVTRDGSASGGYAGWIGSYPGLGDTTASGDPDHDGIPNLLEYVLTGNPGAASTAILPAVTKVAGNFVFKFNRRQTSAQDTTQIFQYRSDLSHWTDALITSPTDSRVAVGTADSNGIQAVTVTIPAGTNVSMFSRLKVLSP